MSTKVYNKEKISPLDVSLFPHYCKNSEGLSEKINERIAHLIENSERCASRDAVAQSYELASRIFTEMRSSREREAFADGELTQKLDKVLERHGIQNENIRVMGTSLKMALSPNP